MSGLRQRRAIRQAETVEQISQTVFATMPVPAIVIDLARSMLLENPRFRELFQFPYACTPREILRVLHPESRATCAAFIKDLDRFVEGQIRIEVRATDGAWVSVIWHVKKVDQALVAIATDFSLVEDASSQTRTMRLERLGRRASEIIHDISGGLRTIRALAGSAIANENKRLRWLDRIDRISGQLTLQLDNALSYSGPQTVRREWVEAGELVGEAITLLGDEESQKVKSGHGPASADLVFCDIQGIGRALTNLLRNACQHATDTVSVEVVSHANDPGPPHWSQANLQEGVVPLGPVTVFAIQDDGVGISEEAMNSLLSGGSQSRRRRGFGIGLLSAAHEVQSHLGLLRISSTEGRGTRAEIVLPKRTDAHKG